MRDANGPRLVAAFPTRELLETLCAQRAEFEAAFGTEEKCRQWWVRARWPGGFSCPRCRSGGRWDTKRGGFRCARCRKLTSLTAGTRLEGTRKPLRKWFEAMYLIVQRGVNARTLQRELGLTYKVAWAWGHKLRSLLGPIVVPPDVREKERRHSSWGAERRRHEPLPAACGCTKLKKRDWRWPDEAEEDREAKADEYYRWVVPPPEQPRDADDVAHHELLATYYGSLSEKHLNVYLEEAAFRWNRRRRAPGEGFLLVARAVGESEPRTYREIVAKKEPDGHSMSMFRRALPS
ncbi:MAG: transposase [Planctomycetota bacterium]